VTLFDGKSLDNWRPVGDANWRIEDGVLITDKGKGNMVSKRSFKDFQVKAELWVAPESNTGVYIRIQNPERPNSTSAYEVNINDLSTNIGYGTGAIVGVAKVEESKFRADNRWNDFDITARGPHIDSRHHARCSSRRPNRFAGGRRYRQISQSGYPRVLTAFA